MVGCWCTAGPNPVASLLQHINPLKLVPFLRQRARQVTKLVWQAEDLARSGAKHGFAFAIKAARPVVVGECLHLLPCATCAAI